MLELLLAVVAFVAGYHQGKDRCQEWSKPACPPCTTVVVSPSDTLRIKWWTISPDSTRRTW